MFILHNIDVVYSKAWLFWSPSLTFKAAQITLVANVWKPLDATEIEPCTVIFKPTGQSAQTGGRGEKQIPNDVSEYGL